MADSAFPRKFPPLIFFQPLNHNKVQMREYTTQCSHTAFIICRVIKRQTGNRMVGTESFGIEQVCGKLFGFILIGNFGKQRPKTGDCLLRQFLFIRIDIVIKTRFGIPHKGIDTGFQGKINPLILKTQFLVVKDIAQHRHIQRINRNRRIKIHQIRSFLTRCIVHFYSCERDGIQSVRLFKRSIQPLHIAG